MSEQSPYEQLGVTEEASFEEIQAARDRLHSQYNGDEKQLQQLEAAYDSVLMDRLRLRQEGKIKVPDRIRFPERLTPAPASPPSKPASSSPNWLQRLVDTPSQGDILLPAGILAVLSALVLYAPAATQVALIIGMGTSLYFLYRKEQKLGRAVLLSLGGLFVGVIVGGLLLGLLPMSGLAVSAEAVVAVVTFVVFWAITSFLR